jgi:hypothetical protein
VLLHRQLSAADLGLCLGRRQAISLSDLGRQGRGRGGRARTHVLCGVEDVEGEEELANGSKLEKRRDEARRGAALELKL